MNQYQIETYNIYQQLLVNLDLSCIGVKKQWNKFYNSYACYFGYSKLSGVDLLFSSNTDCNVSYCLNINTMLCNNNVVIYINKLIGKRYVINFEIRKEFINRPTQEDIFNFIKCSLPNEFIINEQLSLFDF